MMGKKDRDDEVFHYFRMHEQIEDGHILKLIDRHVDFSFVRQRVKHLYSKRGRDSIDPEVMVRMILVGYLYGITSERTLCSETRMHLGYRWFAKLNMNDTVPDHSTFSKNRHGRFSGSGLWEEIFDEIVRQCIEVGLVKGNHVTVDGTLVAADASVNSMEPVVVEMTPREFLDKLKERNHVKEDDPDGERPDEFKRKGTKISNDTHRSTTDPDARLARKKKFGETKLSYQACYVMDNASRVVLDADVSGECGRGVEMAAALAGLERIRWKYKLAPETIGGDKGYAAGHFIRDAYNAGVTPHVPVWDTRREHDAGIYPIEKFTWNEETGAYTCPEGKTLKTHGAKRGQIIWRASTKDCGRCPAKKLCTGDRARSLSRHEDHEYIELAKKEMKTRGYKLSQRKRKQIEELFGEAKELMGFRRMKFRGRATVKEQVLLTAAVQNIKRLVKHLAKGALKPAGALRATPETTEKQWKMELMEACLCLLETVFALSINFSGVRRKNHAGFAV
jgi:transposase